MKTLEITCGLVASRQLLLGVVRALGVQLHNSMYLYDISEYLRNSLGIKVRFEWNVPIFDFSFPSGMRIIIQDSSFKLYGPSDKVALAVLHSTVLTKAHVDGEWREIKYAYAQLALEIAGAKTRIEM